MEWGRGPVGWNESATLFREVKTSLTIFQEMTMAKCNGNDDNLPCALPLIDRYLDRHGPVCLNTKEALAQAQQLAEIVYCRRGYQKEQISSPYAYSPLHGLLEVLSIAQKFVHFMTYGGIPHLLIGALKVTAQRVAVRSVVSGAPGEVLSDNTVSELTNYPEEAPAMDGKMYDPSLTGWKSMPHQKLIIIDGLL
jgi:hypothetical protein